MVRYAMLRSSHYKNVFGQLFGPNVFAVRSLRSLPPVKFHGRFDERVSVDDSPYLAQLHAVRSQ